MSAKEQKLFGELSEITSRFSPFEEDLKEFDCYFYENDVERKAKAVLKALRKELNRITNVNFTTV